MEKYKLFLTLTLIILIKCDTNIENKSQQPNHILKNEEEIIHRFEPYNIYMARREFILSNFDRFSNYITIKKPSSLNEKLQCIFKSDLTIDTKTSLFSYTDKDILNSNSENIYYPFKKNISEFLSKNLTLSFQTQKKLALSLYILYELKGNLTQTLYTMNKQKETNELISFRKYLKYRPTNTFIINYIHNLPLSGILNYYTWSLDEFYDYGLTGNMKPRTQLKTLHGIYEKIKNLFENNTIINDWLSKENENVFYSIYHYINIYSFEYSTNANNNKEDDDKSLSIIIFPFIDICSNSNEESLLKININKNAEGDNLFNLFSSCGKNKISKNKGEVFKYKYNENLSNDNSLLNYGIINKNNLYHNYIITMDLYDEKYEFYKYLTRQNINMENIHILTDDVITAKFELNSENLNKNLLEFLFYFNQFDEIKESETLMHKFNTKKYRYYEGTVNYMLKKTLDKSDQKTLGTYMRYYSTIFSHVKNIEENMKEYLNISMSEYVKEINKFEKEIKDMDKNIEILDQGNIIDHFENLYYYNRLHELLNKKNIHIFNIENIKILMKHLNFVSQDILSIQYKVLNNSFLKDIYNL
jgi:hypothetical protein